jgi:hypothetical protein
MLNKGNSGTEERSLTSCAIAVDSINCQLRFEVKDCCVSQKSSIWNISILEGGVNYSVTLERNKKLTAR